MKKNGFTLIELIIALTMTSILFGTVIVLFTSYFSVWNSSEKRSNVRTEISQALELMTMNLRQAKSIDVIAADSIKFTADLGSGDIQYRFHLYQPPGSDTYLLLKGLGADAVGQGSVMIRGVDSNTVFSLLNQLVSIDLTGTNNGSTVYMRTNVRPRNL